MKEEKIVVVRPRQDGKWEVVRCTREQNETWRNRWDAWWEAHGEQLQAKNPTWWAKHLIPTG